MLLIVFSGVVRRADVQVLLRKTRQFGRDAVKDYNSTADEVTQSLLLGVSGIDEKDTKGAAIAAVELRSLFGMIKKGDNGRMQKADDFEHR